MFRTLKKESVFLFVDNVFEFTVTTAAGIASFVAVALLGRKLGISVFPTFLSTLFLIFLSVVILARGDRVCKWNLRDKVAFGGGLSEGVFLGAFLLSLELDYAGSYFYLVPFTLLIVPLFLYLSIPVDEKSTSY